MGDSDVVEPRVMEPVAGDDGGRMYHAGDSVLDRPVSALVRLNLEQAAYLLLIVLALATRLWDVGARAMSHDESLHALFSWKLYTGEGYVHDPMMHGTFLFIANAFVYFLFGVSDFTARIVPALFGVAAVGLPYYMRRYLGRAGALVAAFLLLIGPSFLYYSRYIRNDIYIIVWTMVAALALLEYLRERRGKWLVLGALALSVSIASKEVAFIVGFIGVTWIVLGWAWERGGRRLQPWLQLGSLAAALLLVAAVLALHLVSRPDPTGAPTLATRLAPDLLFAALLLASAFAATLFLPRGGQAFVEGLRAINWRALRLPAIVFFGIYVVLFTTFFTNPRGIYSGSVGAVAYWLAQQPVQRGGQPWYYYVFLMPFYELIPFFVGIPALAYVIYKAARRRLPEDLGNPYWLSFLVYWSLATFVIYSWAGEKMPWLVVHPALPLLLLAAQVIGRWIGRQDWRAWWSGGGAVAGGILLLAGVALVIAAATRPFTGVSLAQLEATGRWIGALVVLILAAWGLRHYLPRIGWAGIATSARVTALALLVALTVRFAWMSTYVNYDHVNEFLVYAHGAPDIKVVLNQIDEISRRTAGGREIRFSYDQASVWPFEWYFKDYPNRIFYGNEPTKAAMETPVVIVNSDNEAKARPFLGENYHRFEHRLVWWPQEEYKNLTPARIWRALGDGATRDKWFDIWLYRRYPTPFSDWPYQNRFYLYIRKDVLNQMWDMGVTLAIPSEAPADPYQEVWRDEIAALTIDARAGAGEMSNPRGLATAANGDLYVTDSGNNRVLVFDAEGRFLRSWGSGGSAPGQFVEPWGIAVGPNGNVYIADTWNHRVQVFDGEGNFEFMFGFFADVQGDAQGSPGGFWGPRDLVVDAAGDVFVTDTGNKRVQRFSAEGEFVAAYGSHGAGPGQFDEPVGLARDEQGFFYVADTWNRRVQVFDADFQYVREWQVSSWQGSGLLNKPYIAAGADFVYATDPEGYRVLVFDKEGSIRLTFGRYGAEAGGMDLPTGLAVDGQGRLWLSDAQNNRILRFDSPRP